MPTAAQYEVLVQSIPTSSLPMLAPGLISVGVQAAPFHKTTSPSPATGVLYEPTPPAAAQNVEDVQSTPFSSLFVPDGGTVATVHVPLASVSANPLLDVTPVPAEFSRNFVPTRAQLVVDGQETPRTSSSQVPDALPWGCGMLSTCQCAPSKLSAQA